MNIITAMNNKELYQQLKKEKSIHLVGKDISYREGILEILETNPNIQYILISEEIDGQMKLEELIRRIKKINPKIKLLFILNKREKKKEASLLKNKISYLPLEEVTVKKLLEKIFQKKKIMALLGTYGSGKTITTVIFSELLIREKNKKVLIIEDNINNNSIAKLYQQQNTTQKVIQIKPNLALLRIKELLVHHKKDKVKIINEINRLKTLYDYILIDMQNLSSYSLYQEIISDPIVVLTPNLLEINKVKAFLLKNKTKVILNNYNENVISEHLFKNIFKNKTEVLGKIKTNKTYNLIINHQGNIKYLDKKTERSYLKMIEKIEKERGK